MSAAWKINLNPPPFPPPYNVGGNIFSPQKLNVPPVLACELSLFHFLQLGDVNKWTPLSNYFSPPQNRYASWSPRGGLSQGVSGQFAHNGPHHIVNIQDVPSALNSHSGDLLVP